MLDAATHTVKKEELEAFVKTLLEALKKEVATTGAVVVALHGDLGAGKTTLIQVLGKALGVIEPITSPTFTIMKHYDTQDSRFKSLVHMDAYRIDEVAELGPLHFSELLAHEGTLLCIEWAEKIAAALPSQVLTLSLEVVDENTRTVHISRS